MGVSEVLDVAIGVVFVWFLLSVAVSAVNEAFAWMTRMRAKQLWRSLACIVDGTVKPQARLRDLLWRVPVGIADYRPAVSPNDPGADHSALSARREQAGSVPGAADVPAETSEFLERLRERLARSLDDTASSGWRTRISHVPPQLLSDALLGIAEETVTRASLSAAAERLGVTIDDDWWSTLPARGAVEDADRLEPPDVSPEVWREVLAEAKRVVTIDDLESIIAGNPQLATALRRVRDAFTGNEAVVGARRAIEQWFDAEMDALSRFYRRQNRKIGALIALVLVFVVQADSFRLIGDLWHDKDLRAVLANNAVLTANANLDVSDPDSFLELCREVSGIDATTATTTVSESAPTTTSVPTSTTVPASSGELAEAEARLQCAVELVQGTRRFELVQPVAIWNEMRDMNEVGAWEGGDPGAWLVHRVPGRLVTAAALLFGAGFWYDALRRLVGLKGKAQEARRG